MKANLINVFNIASTSDVRVKFQKKTSSWSSTMSPFIEIRLVWNEVVKNSPCSYHNLPSPIARGTKGFRNTKGHQI